MRGTPRLTAADFAGIITVFAPAGLDFTEEDAEARLAAFRATYEPFLNGLAHHLCLSLPGWLPVPGQVGNWVNTPRRRSAKRLFESMK